MHVMKLLKSCWSINTSNSSQVKLSKMQKVTTKSEERLKEVNKVLDELKSSIEALFYRVGCDQKPIREMLGGEGISNKNVMMYLGQIEQRTTEFLTFLNFIKLQVFK